MAPARTPSESSASSLPTVTISANQSSIGLNLREIWDYRDLFYLLALRDIQVRYKQTAMGAAWAIIQPLASTVIFSVLLGRLAKVPSDGVPYPLHVFAGMTLWTFFANSVTNGGNSLVGNSNLVTKVYFPRIIMPAAAVAAGLLDFAIAFVVQLGLLAYYRVALTIDVLAVLPIVAITVVLGAAVGLWMSALNVKYRDVRYAIPFAIQLWMFATPIIYPSTLVPAKWRWLTALNPMTGLVDGFRSALLNRPFDWLSLGFSALLTGGILLYASFSFRRMERHFADVV